MSDRVIRDGVRAAKSAGLESATALDLLSGPSVVIAPADWKRLNRLIDRGRSNWIAQLAEDFAKNFVEQWLLLNGNRTRGRRPIAHWIVSADRYARTYVGLTAACGFGPHTLGGKAVENSRGGLNGWPDPRSWRPCKRCLRSLVSKPGEIPSVEAQVEAYLATLKTEEDDEWTTS